MTTLPYSRPFLARRLVLGVLSPQLALKKRTTILKVCVWQVSERGFQDLKVAFSQQPPISQGSESNSCKEMNSAKLGSRSFPNQASRWDCRPVDMIAAFRGLEQRTQLSCARLLSYGNNGMVYVFCFKLLFKL